MILPLESQEKIEKIVNDVALRESCRLYDWDFINGPQRVLRIYIESLEGQTSVDDCANVSRGVNLLLDVEDPIPGGAYQLEISTPGLERKLRKEWHFKGAIGMKIEVKLSRPLGDFGVDHKNWIGCKKFKAIIVEVISNQVELELEEILKPGENLIKVKLPIDVFEKAKTIFEIKKTMKATTATK